MSEEKRTIFVCQSDTCLSRQGKEILDAFEAAELPDDVEVVASGCLGQCNMGANARITPEETWYCRLTPEDVEKIVRQHLENGQQVTEKLHPRIHLQFSFGLPTDTEE